MNKASTRGRNRPNTPHATDVTNSHGTHAGTRRAAHSLIASKMTASEITPALLGTHRRLCPPADSRDVKPEQPYHHGTSAPRRHLVAAREVHSHEPRCKTRIDSEVQPLASGIRADDDGSK